MKQQMGGGDNPTEEATETGSEVQPQEADSVSDANDHVQADVNDVNQIIVVDKTQFPKDEQDAVDGIQTAAEAIDDAVNNEKTSVDKDVAGVEEILDDVDANLKEANSQSNIINGQSEKAEELTNNANVISSAIDGIIDAANTELNNKLDEINAILNTGSADDVDVIVEQAKAIVTDAKDNVVQKKAEYEKILAEVGSALETVQKAENTYKQAVEDAEKGKIGAKEALEQAEQDLADANASAALLEAQAIAAQNAAKEAKIVAEEAVKVAEAAVNAANAAIAEGNEAKIAQDGLEATAEASAQQAADDKATAEASAQQAADDKATADESARKAEQDAVAVMEAEEDLNNIPAIKKIVDAKYKDNYDEYAKKRGNYAWWQDISPFNDNVQIAYNIIGFAVYMNAARDNINPDTINVYKKDNHTYVAEYTQDGKTVKQQFDFITYDKNDAVLGDFGNDRTAYIIAVYKDSRKPFYDERVFLEDYKRLVGEAEQYNKDLDKLLNDAKKELENAKATANESAQQAADDKATADESARQAADDKAKADESARKAADDKAAAQNAKAGNEEKINAGAKAKESLSNLENELRDSKDALEALGNVESRSEAYAQLIADKKVLDDQIEELKSTIEGLKEKINNINIPELQNASNEALSSAQATLNQLLGLLTKAETDLAQAEKNKEAIDNVLEEVINAGEDKKQEIAEETERQRRESQSGSGSDSSSDDDSDSDDSSAGAGAGAGIAGATASTAVSDAGPVLTPIFTVADAASTPSTTRRSGVAGVRVENPEDSGDDTELAVTEAEIPRQGVVEEDLTGSKDDTDKKLVKIEDNELPLAAMPDEEGQNMSWWWLLIAALLGTTGAVAYENHKKKKAQKEEVKKYKK